MEYARETGLPSGCRAKCSVQVVDVAVLNVCLWVTTLVSLTPAKYCRFSFQTRLDMMLRWNSQSNELLIPKTIGNRKRDCAWGCAWGINTTWENLQIEKHKSVRWAERTPSWFVLFDLQIFSGGVYSPSATSRTISFSISNSFWY